MELINVLVAAAVAFGAGALWYGKFSEQWMAASGVAVGEDGKPVNSSNPMLYATAFLATVICAGMIRHVFELSSIDTIGKGLVSGLGIGLFIVTPWMSIHYGFAGKPRNLLLIDGGYATLGCTLIGIVLTLF